MLLLLLRRLPLVLLQSGCAAAGKGALLWLLLQGQ
jgi:hypothetical protein